MPDPHWCSSSMITKDSCAMYALTLSAAGYEVVTAGSAEEAFGLAQQLRPAAMVADVRLPGVSGLDLTRQLRADDRTRDMAILLLTGDADVRARAAEVGADRVLLKPVLPAALAAAIAATLANAPPSARRCGTLHRMPIH